MTEKCPPTALWPGSFPSVPFPGLPLPHLCAAPLRYHQIADFLGQILPKARLFGRSCPQMYGLSWSCEKVSSIFYAGSPLPTRCPDVIRPSIYERFTPKTPGFSIFDYNCLDLHDRRFTLARPWSLEFTDMKPPNGKTIMKVSQRKWRWRWCLMDTKLNHKLVSEGPRRNFLEIKSIC